MINHYNEAKFGSPELNRLHFLPETTSDMSNWLSFQAILMGDWMAEARQERDDPCISPWLLPKDGTLRVCDEHPVVMDRHQYHQNISLTTHVLAGILDNTWTGTYCGVYSMTLPAGWVGWFQLINVGCPCSWFQNAWSASAHTSIK